MTRVGFALIYSACNICFVAHITLASQIVCVSLCVLVRLAILAQLVADMYHLVNLLLILC